MFFAFKYIPGKKQNRVASVFKLHVMRMYGGEEVKLNFIDQFGPSGSASCLYLGDTSFESRLGRLFCSRSFSYFLQANSGIVP
jgi:hypothetical protein